MVRSEIIEWARINFENGYTIDQIRNSLLSAGYPSNYVNEVIRVGISQGGDMVQSKDGSKGLVINPLFGGGGPIGVPLHPGFEEQKFIEEPKEEIKEIYEKKNFFERHLMGLGLIIVGVLIMNALVGMVGTPPAASVGEPVPIPKPAAEFSNLFSQVITQKLDERTVYPLFITLRQDDSISSEELTPATNGSPIIFCSGKVSMPNGCDEKEWLSINPCTEVYSFKNQKNSPFISDDTGLNGFTVSVPTDGELKFWKACGIYYIGFQSA
ncbi:hypothetical protein K8R43_02690 [archaeon]|nr:hypothetical protein [archaeon]